MLKNVGGRLFLQMQGINCPEEKPFWLFYLNERVFPLGWAEQKGVLLKYSFRTLLYNQFCLMFRTSVESHEFRC